MKSETHDSLSLCDSSLTIDHPQWIGEAGLRDAAEGRVVTVKLACKDASPKPTYPGVFTPCVAFRVAGSPSKNSTYNDGIVIMLRNSTLYIHEENFIIKVAAKKLPRNRSTFCSNWLSFYLIFINISRTLKCFIKKFAMFLNNIDSTDCLFLCTTRINKSHEKF